MAFGGDASWYVSDRISGPVTFGWLRPTILLPAKVCELTPSAQEAIASHELFHVHRRDWLFVMAEELIRSVLWFHPAVWFVLVTDPACPRTSGGPGSGECDARPRRLSGRLGIGGRAAAAAGRRASAVISEETPARRARAGAVEGDVHVRIPSCRPCFGRRIRRRYRRVRRGLVFPVAKRGAGGPGRSRHYGRCRRNAGASHSSTQSGRYGCRGRCAAGAVAQFQRRGRRCARAEWAGRVAQGRAGERAGVALPRGYGPAFCRPRDDSLRRKICRSGGTTTPPPPPPASARELAGGSGLGSVGAAGRGLELRRPRPHCRKTPWCNGSSFQASVPNYSREYRTRFGKAIL